MGYVFDLAIVGGGINGVGIARDAAGRGYSVLLCEKDDLASATSSASTKLIHGGLRYLEYYEFRLVREALAEREALWKIAPHLVQPLRLVLPHHSGLRPAWFLRLGLLIYDHLGARRLLPPTKTLRLESDEAGHALHPNKFSTGFEFSDCIVDDARLVVLNALDAVDRGAVVKTRTKVTEAKAVNGTWNLKLENVGNGTVSTASARCLINAAGPWAGEVARAAGVAPTSTLRLVKGSHIVVPKLFGHDRAYLLQSGDGRVVFAIPYRDDYTLIGTTDRDYTGDPKEVRIADEEVDYLCATIGEYFRKPISRDDVIWSYAGVRPLYGDGGTDAKAVTRDYHLELPTDGEAPVLSIFGGKLTTYRRLAEDALAQLEPVLNGNPNRNAWTAGAALPGGDLEPNALGEKVNTLHARYPFITRDMAERLTKAYGTNAGSVLGPADSLQDLGDHFGADLYANEIRYLVKHEWAQTAEDVLWRRSKLGLRLKDSEAAAVDAFMAQLRIKA